MHILRLDTSARRDGSLTRHLADRLERRLLARHPDAAVTRRDLGAGVPTLDPAGISGVRGEPGDDEARRWRALSDTLVDEIRQADAIVLAVPIYNFGPPAALKAWFDLIARARVTFRYSPDGPVGLIDDKPVYVVIASGGTRIDSPIDFLTPWLRHVLGFVGLHDLRIVDATGTAFGIDEVRARAEGQIDALVPAAGGQAVRTPALAG